MTLNFDFNPGDILYIAYPKYNKVCKFKTDCIKVFKNNEITVHGYVYDLYGHWETPTEVSLKYLDKRIIFHKKTDAIKWMESRKVEKECISSGY